MQRFDLNTIVQEMSRGPEPRPWREFLRVPSLSMGLYRLKPGDADRQSPHTEDEVYYVIAGRATFRSGTHEQPVGPGTILFVERLLEHRFLDIREDLTVLVFFAPAEHSQSSQPPVR